MNILILAAGLLTLSNDINVRRMDLGNGEVCDGIESDINTFEHDLFEHPAAPVCVKLFCFVHDFSPTRPETVTLCYPPEGKK